MNHKTILNKQLILLLPLATTTAFSAIYTGGHGDLGVALENGTDLHFHIHLHGGAVVDGSPLAADEEYDAGDLTIQVPGSTEVVVGGSIPAAGVNSGDSLWILPQSNPGTNTIPFLGIATEELNPLDWLGDITFKLDSVVSPSGSGTFALWQPDGLGGLEFYFSSADQALTVSANNLYLSTGVHDHFNFGFSEVGIWQVQMTVSGNHSTLGPLSDTQTFGFAVVPEPSSAAFLLGSSALILAAVKRRRS